MPEIGKALKRAVEQKPQEGGDDRSRKGPTSALMNANRRNIFQFLCLRPCSRIDSISTNVSQSRSSVSWHLTCLIDAGYVQTFQDHKKKAYYPSGLISSKNLRIYSVLGGEQCKAIYQAVLRSPGADAGLLGRDADVQVSTLTGCLKNLLEIGMITRVMDGRHARYFPTEKNISLVRDERAACKDFVRSLIRKMADDHLKPELTDLKGPNLVIEIRVLGQKERFEIPQRILLQLDYEE
jgi:DNA-binding transcriptional ArsR family regulator